MKKYFLSVLAVCIFSFTQVQAQSVPVTGVNLSQASANLGGGSTTLTATVLPENATNKTVFWTSSNPAVATATQTSDTTATVRAVGAGTATITVITADGKKTASCQVTPIPVTGVELSPASANMTVDGSGRITVLTATVLPENAANKRITWSVAPDGIVNLTPGYGTDNLKCIVIAVSVGTATITATAEDGKKTASCQVTVPVPVPATGVDISQTSSDLFVGAITTLTATVQPENATNKSVIWTSSNEAVATVTPGGANKSTCTVTAVSVGTATITVTTADGNVTVTRQVTVTVPSPVTGVELSPASANLTVGSITKLTTTVLPENAANKRITWSVAPDGIVNLTRGFGADSSNCIVTAVSGGTATITVTTEDGNKTDSCQVTVPDPVSGVYLSQTYADLTVGATTTLTATVLPNTANKTVRWASSNSAVATVSPGGANNSTCTVTARNDGTATITVTTEDGNKTENCQVTVTGRVTGVELSSASENLTDGASTTLTATVLPGNAVNKNILYWWSSNRAVATVSPASPTTATVHAVGAGTATITVTTEDGNKRANCRVTVPVADVEAQSLRLSLSPGTAMARGTGNVYLSVYLNNNPSWVSDYQFSFSLPSYITPEVNSITWYRLSRNHTSHTVTRSSEVNTDYTVRVSADPATPVSNIAGELVRIPLTVDWDNAPVDIEQTISAWDIVVSGVIDGVKQFEKTVPDASINFTILSAVPDTQVQAQSLSLSLYPGTAIARGTDNVYLSISLNDNPSWVDAYGLRFSLPPYITAETDSVTWYRLSGNHSPSIGRNLLVNTKYVIITYSLPRTPISNTSGELVRIPLTVDWDNAPADIEQTIPAWGIGVYGNQIGETVLPDASINFTILSGVPVPATGVDISQTSDLSVGAITTLTATVQPENATNKNVIWVSSNEAVATVTPTSDTTATVHAVGNGTVTITAEADNGNINATRTTDAAGNGNITEAAATRTVNVWKRGDANGSGSVSALDINVIVSHLLGNNPQPFIPVAADFNNSGSISALDINAIVNYLLGR